MPGKNVHRGMVLLVACCLASSAGTAFANSHMKDDVKDSTAAPAGKTDADHDEMAKAMAKLAMPGKQHAWLKGAEGKWKATVKSWIAPGDPTVSKGTSVTKMIMGGRYLEENFQSTMMDQPFEGYGLSGYDNLKNQFWSVWIDNMSTGVMLMSEGTLDESGKVLTCTGKGPAPDGSPVDYRMVTEIIDDKTHVFTMYGTTGGKEMKMMEITYTR